MSAGSILGQMVLLWPEAGGTQTVRDTDEGSNVKVFINEVSRGWLLLEATRGDLLDPIAGLACRGTGGMVLATLLPANLRDENRNGGHAGQRGCGRLVDDLAMSGRKFGVFIAEVFDDNKLQVCREGRTQEEL